MSARSRAGRTPRGTCCAAVVCAGLIAVARGATGVAAGERTSASDAPCDARSGQSQTHQPRFTPAASCVERAFQLFDERLALMPAVAAWKWQHHAPVSDPVREQAVVHAAAKLATPLGLPPAAVERIFSLQVRLARDEESALQSRWRRSGYDFTARVPDLSAELRPRLDHLTRELVRALYLSAPALARPDFAARYAMRAAQLLTSAGWSDASRAELLTDLEAIRLTSAPALQRIEASHVLRIGTTGDYAPFSAESHGELRGLDIELASALARRLGAEPIFVRTSWTMLLEDLRRNAFDVAISGISATPERGAAAATSLAYLSGGKTIIARCRDAHRFDSLAAVDVPGVRVVVNPGGTNEQYARTHLHRAQLSVFPDNRRIFEELIAGRADVMITDDVEVELQIERRPELCRALAGTLTHADKVLLMPRDPMLRAIVNDWLRGQLAADAPARLLRQALSSPGHD
jgi:cyclohexadienyl dehydratase